MYKAPLAGWHISQLACLGYPRACYFHAMLRFFSLGFISTTLASLSRLERRGLMAFLLLHATLTLWFSWQQSPIFDEPDYFAYTILWAKGKPERIQASFDSKSPATFPALWALALKPVLPTNFLSTHPHFFLKAGRVAMYLYPLLAFCTLCCWLRRWLGGHRLWWLPAVLFAFDPTVFSHSMVVGTDLASASLLLTAFYCFWRYQNSQSRRYWWMYTVFFGLAVVTKASMVYAYPLVLLLTLVQAGPAKRWRVLGRWPWQPVLLFVVVQLLIINLAYYGKGSLTPFEAYNFQSATFKQLQQQLGFLGQIWVPLPAAFVQGIDMLQFHAHLGGCLPQSTYPGVWLLGHGTCNSTFWYYYLVLATFKMPLLMLFLMALALVLVVRKPHFKFLLRRHACIWLPLLWFLGILSFFNPFQIGWRHALIILPFVYLCAAPALVAWHRRTPVLLYLALALHTMGLVYYWPNSIAYTNLLVGNKKMVYKKFRDSSLDYGQNASQFKALLASSPNLKQPTAKPDTGQFAMLVHQMQQHNMPASQKAAWLFNNFEPYAHVNHTILLFRVSQSQLATLPPP